MPPFDREAALKSAEKALRQGRLDAAIAEYVKVVEAQPRNWNSANALGDLAARQGTLADAKQYFHTVADRRKARGDKKGAAEITIRLGTLDPDDLEARMRSAHMAGETGDAATALREFCDVAARYEKQDCGADAGTWNTPPSGWSGWRRRRPTRSLWYDLAQTQGMAGESSRALAVFVELESASGGSRDVSGHIDRLSKVQARG